jgi:hypothetical protein
VKPGSQTRRWQALSFVPFTAEAKSRFPMLLFFQPAKFENIPLELAIINNVS